MSTNGMGLETLSSAPMRSPFQDLLDNPSSQIEGPSSITELGESLALAPLFERGLFELRGRNLAEAMSIHLSRPGEVLLHGDALIARLRPDHWLAVTRSRDAIPAFSDFTADNRTGELTTLTDITHGRACLLLIGARATEVLTRLCGLDFSEAAFPHAHAAQASLAKVRSLIIRWDLNHLPAYFISVERSLARYISEAILAEMEEYHPRIWKAAAGIEDWPTAQAAAT